LPARPASLLARWPALVRTQTSPGPFGATAVASDPPTHPLAYHALSLAMYDYVEALQWDEAHVLAAGLVVFSFAVIVLAMVLERRLRRLPA